MIVCLGACQTEPIPDLSSSTVEEFKTLNLSEAKNLFQETIEKSVSSKISDGTFFTPIWEEAHYEDLNNTDEKMLVIPAENRFRRMATSRILMWEKDGRKIVRAFTMFPDGIYSSPVFKGKMIVTDLHQNFIIGYRAKDGLIFAKLFKGKKRVKTDWDLGELDEVELVHTPTTNTDEMDDGSDSSGGGTYPEEEEPTWDYDQLPGGGGGGEVTEGNEEEDASVNRDPSFVAIDKINCTYEQLKKAQALEEILTDFFGEDADFNITYSVEKDVVCNGKTTATGCATQIDDHNYIVKIDEDYITDNNTPTIFLAQSIIHESIHANLYSAVVKHNNGEVPADVTFEGLYKDYAAIKEWQHEMMADHYRGIMQKAIKAVHPLLNDNGFLTGYDDNSRWTWEEFYEYLSYRGLKDTEAGKIYYAENIEDISLYFEGAKTNSTKTPVCDEVMEEPTLDETINDGSEESLTQF